MDYISRIQSIKNTKSLNSCFITSINLLTNNLSCHTALFYNLEKKKIREKLHTSLHYCLLSRSISIFQILSLFFSRGLNSTDNNLRDVSLGLDFTNGKFLWYFARITFFEKFEICEICKIGSTRKLTHLRILTGKKHRQIKLQRL